MSACASHAVTKARLAKARVLVVGDAMLDRYWFGNVERISPEAPVPVVHVQREEERLGGAANVALNVTRLGARASLVTALGQDEPAERLVALLGRAGIALSASRHAALRTTVKLRVVGRSQQLLRVDFETAPGTELLDRMLAEYRRALADHDAVLFSDYGKGGLANVQPMIALARAAGKPVLVDPKGRDFSRYAGADVITPNRGELALAMGAWSDEAQLASQAQALRRGLCVGGLLVTRSEEGMSLFDDDGVLHVAAQALQVYDVTGAGDTVIATLATLVAAGVPLREAVPLANRAGGIVVSRFGTASVTCDELLGPGAPHLVATVARPTIAS